MKTLVQALYLALLLSFGVPAFAQTGKFYKYSELYLRNYDEMRKAVQKYIQRAQSVEKHEASADESTMMADEDGNFASDGSDEASDAESVEILRQATRLILSRPNKDNMLEKLMPMVRRELAGLSAFEDTLSGLATEALTGIKQEKLPAANRATYLIMLENLISEMKPEADREEIYPIVAKIRDAKVKVTDDVKSELRLKAMITAPDPSAMAGKVLTAVDKKRKSEAEKNKGKPPAEKDSLLSD